MKTCHLHRAKTHRSRLVEAAASGEEIVIAKAGTPMARLVAMSASAGPRVPGVLAGQVRESGDCWAPDPDIEALFYGTGTGGPQLRRVAEPPPDEWTSCSIRTR